VFYVYYLLATPLYIFFGLTYLKEPEYSELTPYLLQNPICNSNPIKLITHPDSVGETILVDVSYVNYDRLGLI